MMTKIVFVLFGGFDEQCYSGNSFAGSKVSVYNFDGDTSAAYWDMDK